MDSFDRRILQFVLAWAPYGGPREDEVWNQFGMTVEQLRDRFSRLVTDLVARLRSLPATDRALVEKACVHLGRERRSRSAERDPQALGLAGQKRA
ncbi:hypothetical protein M1247_26815 [Mycobacterium sp. 21AC1]|uniref:hypothetical protein n=1 Tax=[Mycobacterium] appelbergii TaxID=2939269 RepID=UPI0029392B9A|nr:hypothetical protein [Mycobacterium sp. 21AC1]MDV3128547.1 hypothetical protein [Mycobacterium sp. 21AC1]